jgi:hypothetical protein
MLGEACAPYPFEFVRFVGYDGRSAGEYVLEAFARGCLEYGLEALIPNPFMAFDAIIIMSETTRL